MLKDVVGFESIMPLAEVGTISLGLCPENQEAYLQSFLADVMVRTELGQLGNHIQILTGSTDKGY